MADQVSYPCPKCGTPRVTRISHTAKNPERAFLTCPKNCEGSFKWVDTLPKYEFVRPLDARTPSQWTKDFLAKVNAEHPSYVTPEEKAEAKPVDPLFFLNVTETESKPEAPFIPSKYQSAIFDFVKGDNGNAVIEAVAGSGKTRTLVESLAFTPTSADVAFLAFNRHIARELAERAPAHVHASTLHSLGLQNAKQALGDKLTVNEFKLHDIWDKDIDKFDMNVELKPSAIRLVNLLKTALKEPSKDNIDYLVDHYGIELNGDAERIYEFTEKLYRLSVEDKSQVDYTDMIYLGATGTIPCHRFDIIFQDEAQDASDMQFQMILKSIKPNGRIICVGDSAQAIYSWSGSNIDSMNQARKFLQGTSLPLSICYRCHKGAIRLAKELVPQIEWREDAPEGIVREIATLPVLHSGDLVLCRTNAPLVSPCFDLIRRGVKATIRGRDIGNGLVALLTRAEKKVGKSTYDAIAYLSQYVAQESAKLIRARKEVRASAMQDQYETLLALSDSCETTGEIRRKIQQVFSDESEGVTFSSVHRAKGNEADRVFILRPDLMPFPKAIQDWEVQTERNVKYVALTRPKKELYFVVR